MYIIYPISRPVCKLPLLIRINTAKFLRKSIIQEIHIQKTIYPKSIKMKTFVAVLSLIAAASAGGIVAPLGGLATAGWGAPALGLGAPIVNTGIVSPWAAQGAGWAGAPALGLGAKVINAGVVAPVASSWAAAPALGLGARVINAGVVAPVASSWAAPAVASSWAAPAISSGIVSAPLVNAGLPLVKSAGLVAPLGAVGPSVWNSGLGLGAAGWNSGLVGSPVLGGGLDLWKKKKAAH